MNPAAINFAISFLVAPFLLGENCHSRCFTGLEHSLTSILYSSQLSWDTWHVGRLPSEDIFIVLKKVGEHEFLFCREVGTDGRCFGGITGTQVDLLHVGFFWRSEDARLLGCDL
jgi:hypothetical protein